MQGMNGEINQLKVQNLWMNVNFKAIIQSHLLQNTIALFNIYNILICLKHIILLSGGKWGSW